MKKTLPFFAVLLLALVIGFVVFQRASHQQNLTVVKGNTEKQVLEIIPGKYLDAICGMQIDHLQDAAQVVAPDGRTWFFDDVGCLALWLEHVNRPDEMHIWIYTRDSEKWMNGRKAWFSRNDKTTMAYGFGNYSSPADDRITFNEMLQLMWRGEHLRNPETRRLLNGNN
jgi:copper chaperone NosL